MLSRARQAHHFVGALSGFSLSLQTTGNSRQLKEACFFVGIQPGIRLSRALSAGCSAIRLSYGGECFHPLCAILAMDSSEVFATSPILLLRRLCFLLAPTACKQLTGSLVFDVGCAWLGL